MEADGLVLEGLCIRTARRELVHDVGMTLRPGEIVALVGRSGSGKSLTARALLGLVEIDPGVSEGRLSITVDGVTVHPLDALPQRRRARDRAFRDVRGRLVGYLPQDARAALDPLARVGRQVAASARRAGHEGDPLPWLARANLDEPARVARLWPHELSGGMAQRVVLAQSLARGSRFLLADEPTSALDPTVQRAVLDELRRVADSGIGVLLITHDLRVLPGLADRVVILHAGRVVERTTAEDLVAGNLESAPGRRLFEATRRVAGGVLG